MDCYVCNIESMDENHCEQCRFELQALTDWLQSETGDSSIGDSNSPFLELHEDEARLIKGFLAGAQMPFTVKRIGNLTRLHRIDLPVFSYVPFSLAL